MRPISAQADIAVTTKTLTPDGADALSKRRWSTFRYCLWATMLLCWLVEALSYRQTVGPDGISYLDIASACARGHWASAVNAYWGPAYPVLLSFVFSIFRPAVLRELSAVQIFNCLTLFLALYCFEYLLEGVLQYTRAVTDDDRNEVSLPAWAMRAIGYTFFFWISLFQSPPSLVTPDVLVFISILIAAGIIVRIAGGAGSWLRFVALGIVLAFGFLSKAVMFPLALIFLAAAFLATGNIRRAVPRVMVALFVFLLASAPYLVLLSRSKGRITFGDSGRINYAEYADGVPLYIHWQGTPAGSGKPKHSTRRLLETPPVYEFASPVGGTYPPWSDPSYWYDGVRPHFELRGQLDVLRHSADTYVELFTQLGSLAAGFFVLLLWENRFGDFVKRLWTTSFLWVPALAGLAMYAFIHIEGRFLDGFLLLLWAAIFSSIRISETESRTTIIRCVTLTIILLLDIQIAWSVGHSFVRLASFHSPADIEVAKDLVHDGVSPGDKIAFIGSSISDDYWAYLAGVSIVSEVPRDGVESFWEARPELKTQTLSLFEKSGAKAVLVRGVPQPFLIDGWRELGGTGYFVLLFPSSQAEPIS